MSDSSFLDTTIGVVMIGMTVTAIVFGVTSGQAMWYFRHYPRDRPFVKAMVRVVWVLDTISLVFYFASMWQYLVGKQLDSFGGDALPWTSNAQIISNACSIAIIQSFYMFRIWTLGKNKLLASVLGTFVSADLALSILLCVKSIQTKAIAEFKTLTAFDIAMNSTTAVTDAMLCCSLVTLLARSRTGSTGSNRLINRLLFYTINTGLLTTICSVLSLITVIVLPDTAVYVMFYYIGSRMYSISLLSTLNARESLRTAAEKYDHNSLAHLSSHPDSMSRRSCESSGKGTTSQPQPSREIVVSIQRDMTVTFEEHTAREAAYMKPSKYRLHGAKSPTPGDPTNKPGSPVPSESAHEARLAPAQPFRVVAS